LNYYVYYNDIDEGKRVDDPIYNISLHLQQSISIIDVSDDESDEQIKFSTVEIPISGDNILSYFACAIFYQTFLSSEVILPHIISPLWMLKKMIPIAVKKLPKYVSTI
jgi:hypothetical protein